MSKELSPLKALKEIGKLKESGEYINTTVEYKIIELALKRLETLEEEKQSFDRQLEKSLKAFEIIKEKRVNVEALFYASSCEDYNKHYEHYMDLTQEEYDLLKEVLL